MPYTPPVPSAPPYVPPYNPDFVQPNLTSRLGSLALQIIFGLGQFIKNHPLFSFMLGAAGIYFWSRRNPTPPPPRQRDPQAFDPRSGEWVSVPSAGAGERFRFEEVEVGEKSRRDSPPPQAPGRRLPFSGGFPFSPWSQAPQPPLSTAQQGSPPLPPTSQWGPRRVVDAPTQHGRTEEHHVPSPPDGRDTTHNGDWTRVEHDPLRDAQVRRLNRDPNERTPTRRTKND